METTVGYWAALPVSARIGIALLILLGTAILIAYFDKKISRRAIWTIVFVTGLISFFVVGFYFGGVICAVLFLVIGAFSVATVDRLFENKNYIAS